MVDFQSAYKGKTVLVTGHTGFKGSWLCIWLLEMGANVIGYSLAPTSKRDNFVLSELEKKMIDLRGDIRDKDELERVFKKYEPEMVFHLAAQPLVRDSYECPVYTYETNVMGTLHILECIRNTPSVRCGVLITTDKCYENKEQLWGYREMDPLGGYDPYSSSKAAAEIAIQSWRSSFFNPNNYSEHKKAVASVRAGNVIGGGDWSKDRILPDCIRALEEKRPIVLRSPEAVRPWQHVLEPLGGYLRLGAKLIENPTEFGEAWNFGPYPNSVVSVMKIAQLVTEAYGEGTIVIEPDCPRVHEANLLNLDISKATMKLGWHPVWDVEQCIEKTVEWYKKYDLQSTYELCREQILTYQEDLLKGGY